MIEAASTIAPLEIIDRIYEDALPQLPGCYREFADMRVTPATMQVPA